MPITENKITNRAQPIESYNWGGSCSAFVLAKNNLFTIKQEVIPPGFGEQNHYHVTTTQCFYILAGVAGFEIDDKLYELRSGDCIEIYPGQHHRIFNKTLEEVICIVFSQPSTNNDRINI